MYFFSHKIFYFLYQFLSKMQPLNSQKRIYERMNKTFGIQSKLTIVHNQQKGRGSVLKKIINISSIKQEIKKILLKALQNGGKALEQQSVQIILSHSKSFLDNDKQKILGEDLKSLVENQEEKYPLLFKITKELVISPIEKTYITKIQKQLKDDDALQQEIQKVQFQLEQQKLKKLKVYQMQKSGVTHVSAKNLRTTFKQVENFENKLMRANQKLNEMSSNNEKLRQKINQLRKQKNAMEEIYTKLKKQLQSKKENVEKTIKFAGDAYNARNKAQQDLKHLKQQAQLRKQQFKQECQKLNNEIQHDLRFKQFIKSKEVQRNHLQKLEKEIEQNEYNIELKKEENLRIDQEYKKSLQKQMEIKKSFDKIQKQIGYNDKSGQNKELLNVFINLYEKNIIMKDFVTQITKQVEDLQKKIQNKKEQIQKMYLKGTADQVDKERLNEQYKNKFQFYERKKHILDAQYQKSVMTLQTIKKYLQDIFQQIGIEPQIVQKLKNCNLNQDNLTQFLGQLEKKGLEAIAQYGKLVSEQLKSQKGASWQIQKQIDQLNNIITLENVNAMNNCNAVKITDYPSQLIIKIKDEKIKEDQLDKPLSLQDFKKFAVQSLQQYQKKQIPKQKHFNKKYNIAPMLGKKRK